MIAVALAAQEVRMSWDERVSCKLNILFGGDGRETICSRIWACSLRDWRAEMLMLVIDGMFRMKEKEHCWKAHMRYLRKC